MRYERMMFASLLAMGAVQAQTTAQTPAQGPLYRIGLGSGAGFGGVGGLHAEAEWRRAAVVAGAGSWGDRVGYEAGLRYYFRDAGLRLRPSAQVSYAPTHVIEYTNGTTAYTGLFYGVNLLAGLDHDFGKPGGFMMTYGLGLAIPQRLTQEDADRFEAAGQEEPEADLAPTFALGIKYQF